MRTNDFSKLDKQQMINEYDRLFNQYLRLLAENEVLKAKQKQLDGINQLLNEKINKCKMKKR